MMWIFTCCRYGQHNVSKQAANVHDLSQASPQIPVHNLTVLQQYAGKIHKVLKIK